MAKSVLVTGASGFIGHHLVRGLVQSGHDVTALLRPNSKLGAESASQVKTVLCDDWTDAGLDTALKGTAFQTLFHLASYGVAPDHRDLSQMAAINAVLPMLLVEQCAKRGASMVMAGSSSEYAPPTTALHQASGLQAPDKLDEHAPLETGKLYGSFKAAGSLMALSSAASLNVPLTVLRLFNVYGSGEAAHRLLPSLVRSLGAGGTVALSPGTQVRDFVYVRDVVEAFIQSSRRPVNADNLIQTWNVCTGTGHSVQRYCQIVARLMKKPADQLDFGALQMRADDIPLIVGNPAAINKNLSWKAQYSLEEGLKDILVS